MTSIADGSVKIQTASESNISTPAWFGEIVVISSYLQKHQVLNKINEQVRFARKRFGRYEIIDFLAVLFGYAISGERTLEEFYQRLQPFAVPFMALFDRERLPSRSTLSRFLAVLTEAPVEALRTLFLDDLLARPLTPDGQTGGLVDRAGNSWTVFDIDGTREAARQRALPQTDELPLRRLDDVCAPGYRGRKRGEVVRTRTTVSQAHSYQWLGRFGNRGNGRYREELRKALSAIGRYLTASQLPQERTLLRLDGQYGNGAVLADVAGFADVPRGKDYHLLDHPLIQARLHLPPDQFQQRPRSVRWCATSTIAPRSRWDLRASPAAWSWRRILPRRRRVRSASPEKAWSTNCSSRISRSTPLPPAMWSSCTCIGALLNQFSPMKTSSRTRTGGAVTRPGDRNAGKRCLNGSGTFVWSWGISLSQPRCARPSLLQQCSQPSQGLSQAMARQSSEHPGKRAASPVRTLLSSPMGRCAVLLTRGCSRMSTVEKPMAACAWSMEPASAAVAPVPCVSNANGTAMRPRSRAREVGCCIHCASVLPRCSGTIGAVECIDGPVCSSPDSNGSRLAFPHPPLRRPSRR